MIAIAEHRVIGAAKLYRHGIHPTRWRLAMFVDPDHRRQGVGTALFNACRRDRHLQGGDEIQASASAADVGVVAFLSSLGFTTLMTTHLGPLSWRQIPEIAVADQPAEITTLAARPELRQEVADVHERVYRAQHAWSPVGELTEEFKTSVFLDPDELVPEAQFVALLEGHVVGIASLRAPFSIQAPDLGWIGVVEDPPAPVAKAIHAQLRGACLQFARNHRADTFVEIDEADTLTLEAFRQLPVEWEAPWLNLVLHV